MCEPVVTAEVVDSAAVPVESFCVRAEPGVVSKCCRGPLHPDGVYLTIGSFYKNRHRADGVRSVCKDCERYTSNMNRDRIAEYSRRCTAKRRRLDGRDCTVPGFKERLARFASGGEYRGHDASDAKARLERFRLGLNYGDES